jgi:hypothetical protein
VHISHPQPIREDVLAVVFTFFPFKAVFFSPDRPENVRTRKNTANMASSLACGGLQRQVRLPARFNRLSAAYETGG